MSFTSLRALAIATVLGFASVFTGAPITIDVAVAQAYPPRAEKFDGRVLYQAAFEAIRDKHLKLLEADARDAWAQEWEHKFAGDPKLATESGTDAAIRSLLASLGMRYDRYLGTDFVQVSDALAEGSSSTGVVLKERTVQTAAGPVRQIYVDKLLPASPAEGLLQPGDILKMVACDKIDAQDNTGCKHVADMSGRDVELALYGKEGSQVIVHLIRDNGNDPVSLRVTIARKEMSEHTVVYDASHGDVAVIKVVNFLPADFEKQFETAVKQAVAANVKGIVIDLRGNPGGRTDAAVLAVGNLLFKGKINVVVQRQGTFMTRSEIAANGDYFQATYVRVNVGQRFPSPRPELLVPETMPLAVVIDGKSASASEIFAGALKVNKRAVIVGETSLGKGEGQEVVELPFGRRLVISTFEFRAGGVAHNLKGIEPDLVVPAGTTNGADDQLEAAIANVRTPPASQKAE